MDQQTLNKPYYEIAREPLQFGIRVIYVTAPGGYQPAHWHDEIEILYHLNGESDITIDGKKYRLERRQMVVIDSRQIHSTYVYDPTLMTVCIHISKSYMEKYVPGLERMRIRCTPDDVNDDNFQAYLDICMMLQDLLRAYVRNRPTLPMETEGYVLQIFARVIQNFSEETSAVPQIGDALTADRIRSVITYVDEHYAEPVSLQEAADVIGFNKEYFCRFFKKNMRMTFLQYLDIVRSAHVYEDLEETDGSVAEIMEKNGFTNQKQFNRIFKAIYGCTPSSVRRGQPGD